MTQLQDSAGGWPMALDRPGTTFKGPRSLSNQFKRFFDQQFEIGHFGWTLEVQFSNKPWF